MLNYIFSYLYSCKLFIQHNLLLKLFLPTTILTCFQKIENDVTAAYNAFTLKRRNFVQQIHSIHFPLKYRLSEVLTFV